MTGVSLFKEYVKVYVFLPSGGQKALLFHAVTERFFRRDG